MKYSIGIAMLAAAALVGLPATAQSEPLSDDYAGGEFGRIRDAANGATLLRTEGALTDLSVDLLNTPVFPGDALETDASQRVEVQLAGGSVVRVDRRSTMTFLALPDPYAEIADNTVLQITRGRVALDVRLDSDGEFRVDTPAGTIYALNHADIRIAVDEDGDTRVASRQGAVEVVGDGGSVILRGGTRTSVRAGATPQTPEPFNTLTAGGFDLWVEQREALFAQHVGRSDDSVYAELPHEVRPYYRELSSHGRWVYTDDYGYVWSPTDRPSDWRPYYDGYWSYGSRGYFWVSHEPWGWAPYRYGRWNWASGHGWVWSPGRVFGGAWVAWSWGSAYVGWSPLDCWNRPAYRSVVHYGYYDPYAWTFVSYRHITHHQYHHYAVSFDHVGSHIHRAAVVTRPPKVSPQRLAASVETRQRTLMSLHEDRASRVAPVTSRERPSTGTFAGGEDRWVRDGRRAATAGRLASRTVPTERQVATRPSSNTRTRDTLAPTRRTTVRRTPESVPGNAPVVRDRTSGARGNATPTRRAPATARPGTETQSSPRQVAPRSGSEGRRDVYRRMTQPPQTRSGGAAAPETTTTRPQPAPSRSGASPRPRATPSQRTTPAPAKATTPSRAPSSRSAPKATPRSTAPARPAPKAAPSSRSTSRPAPKAAPSSRSSSRPAPKATPPSRSSSRPAPKAKPPSRSSGGKSGRTARPRK